MAEPNPDQTAGRPACGACCTRVEGLGVRFGSRWVLEGVDLHIHCGQIAALIGPNGAGKTTLLRAIIGDVPHTGSVRFMRARAGGVGAPVVGYVPQRLAFDPSTPLTVEDLFAAANDTWPLFLGRRSRVRALADAALSEVGAGHLMRRMVGQLSGGELQRVMLAMSLVPPPDILLLDEPVAGLDAAGTERFYETVAGLRDRHNLAVIMVSHDLGAAGEVADRMVFLNRSVVMHGPPHKVLADERVQRAFGLDSLARAGHRVRRVGVEGGGP